MIAAIHLNWFGAILVGLFTLAMLNTIHNVGRPRPALAQHEAIIVMVIDLLLISGLLFIGTQR